MTHDEMMRFRKYRAGCAESRAMVLEMAQYVERHFGATPAETQNGYLIYPANFLLIQTIHHALASLTINVVGQPSAFADLAGAHVRVARGQNGYSRLYITHPDHVGAGLEAARRSWQRRNPGPVPVGAQTPPEVTVANQGPGYQHDEEIRQAVENRALDVAEGVYSTRRNTIGRVGRPFDLDCHRQAPPDHRRVEVKGLQAECPADIIVTDGEVRHATESPFPVDLLVVAGIQIQKRGGRIVASGGRIHRHIEGWAPAGCRLTPTQYRYHLP